MEKEQLVPKISVLRECLLVKAFSSCGSFVTIKWKYTSEQISDPQISKYTVWFLRYYKLLHAVMTCMRYLNQRGIDCRVFLSFYLGKLVPEHGNMSAFLKVLKSAFSTYTEDFLSQKNGLKEIFQVLKNTSFALVFLFVLH